MTVGRSAARQLQIPTEFTEEEQTGHHCLLGLPLAVPGQEKLATSQTQERSSQIGLGESGLQLADDGT